LPTRQQGTAPWVEERVDAVVALYQPTRAGEALLRSLDLRQMEGDPGFFGSSLWSSRTHDASVWVNECASLARPVVGLFTS